MRRTWKNWLDVVVPPTILSFVRIGQIAVRSLQPGLTVDPQTAQNHPAQKQ
jgi:hypothetical protein